MTGGLTGGLTGDLSGDAMPPQIPLGMVIKQKWKKVFVSRNEQMRRWVAADTSGRVQLLDFDALSSAPDAPQGLNGNWTDWHYSCKFIWDTPEVRFEIKATPFFDKDETVVWLIKKFS